MKYTKNQKDSNGSLYTTHADELIKIYLDNYKFNNGFFEWTCPNDSTQVKSIKLPDNYEIYDKKVGNKTIHMLVLNKSDVGLSSGIQIMTFLSGQDTQGHPSVKVQIKSPGDAKSWGMIFNSNELK